MADIAIRTDNLGKRYRIGELQRYRALRDVLTNAGRATMRAPLSFRRRSNSSHASDQRHVWALRELSIEIPPGDVVGIIGANGSGKSTLLKILSRITEPTEGRAELHGRVGSLLEVGTGFHYELTGRENIFLNGAILGMKKTEVTRKFDEIVDFAGVEQFIDTPVKLYSTGMYLRLAFAVAAHLEPEILLVDEVLAVGDLEFQKRCLGRMGEVATDGRTVVFVSHTMNHIRRLCNSVLWINGGRCVDFGPTPTVVAAYESAMTLRRDPTPGGNPDKNGFLSWAIVEPSADEPTWLASLDPVTVKFSVRLRDPVRFGRHGIALFDEDGHLMWANAVNNLILESGTHDLIHDVPSLPLKPGTYYWNVSLYDDRDLVDSWESIPPLTIVTPPLSHPNDKWSGVLNLPSEFHTIQTGDRCARS